VWHKGVVDAYKNMGDAIKSQSLFRLLVPTQPQRINLIIQECQLIWLVEFQEAADQESSSFLTEKLEIY
jgi:hypothetical protein